MKLRHARQSLLLLGIVAIFAALVACNALLGNEEPSLAKHADASSDVASQADVVGRVDPPNDAGIDAKKERADAGPAACDDGGPRRCEIVAKGLPGPVVSLTANASGTTLYWAIPNTGTIYSRAAGNTTVILEKLVGIDLVAATEDGVVVASTAGAFPVRYFVGAGLVPKDLTATNRKVVNLQVAPPTSSAVLWSESDSTCWSCGDPEAANPNVVQATTASCDGKAVAGIAGFSDYGAWLMADGRVRGPRFGVADLDVVADATSMAIGGARGAATGGSDEMFWAYGKGGSTHIHRLFAGVFGNMAIAFPDGSRITSFAADSGSVYWMMEETPGMMSILSARRSDLTGVTTIIRGQRSVSRLAVVEDELYWTREEPANSWQLVKLVK